MGEQEEKLCPSSTCHEGAILLGVKQANEEIVLLNYPMQINNEFIQKAMQNGSPEKRLRFADKCLQSGCKQWADNKCGVIRELAEVNNDLLASELPKCIIRPQCRWYTQEGAKACSICPMIITDNTNNT